jgi:lysophospholipase L1-like esterase
MISERHVKCTANIAARGIGGNVAYNGLCRAPQPELPDMDAALYLLEFGTNDLDRPWISPEHYAAALRQFVQMLFVYTDSDVVLLTTGPILGEHQRKPAAYHQVVLAVAREFDIPAVDIERAVNLALAGRPYPTLHLGDEPGRKMEDPHPNDAGHRVWAEATLNVLDPR